MSERSTLTSRPGGRRSSPPRAPRFTFKPSSASATGSPMSNRGSSIQLGLAWKVTFAFGFVVLAALLAVSLLANQATAREVRGFLFRGEMTDSDAMAGALADYYRANGSGGGVQPPPAATFPLGPPVRA